MRWVDGMPLAVQLRVNGVPQPVKQWTVEYDIVRKGLIVDLQVKPEVVAPDLTIIHDLHDVTRAWAKSN